MKILRKIFRNTTLIAAALLLSSMRSDAAINTQASEFKGIAAVVNGDIITFQDLNKRIRFSILSLGKNASPALMEKVQTEMLSEMINELLKWQCCKKYEPKGGWVQKKDVLEAFSGVAKQNNMSSDAFTKFLQQHGVDKELFLTQMERNLSWVEYIKARYGRFVNISDFEMKRTMQDIKEKSDQKSFCVMRMFFPVSNPLEETKISAHANSILNMILQGADFCNTARQFSKSPDSAKGGDLGWIFRGQLSSEEMDALEKMQPGTHKIIRNSRGYALLFLRDKKDEGIKTFTDLKLAQIIIPFGENRSPEAVQHLMSYAAEMKKTAANCHDLMTKAKESGFMGVSEAAKVTLEMMPLQYRNLLISLPAGGISQPIAMPQAIVMFCVLEKKIGRIREPTFDEVKGQKMSERLSVFADRELQDIRKKAFLRINEN